jgi:hypothetical protein
MVTIHTWGRKEDRMERSATTPVDRIRVLDDG